MFAHGIDPSLAEDICRLMEKKPPRVRRAFLLRCRGMKQREIAAALDVCQQRASYILRAELADVRGLLRASCIPCSKT